MPKRSIRPANRGRHYLWLKKRLDERLLSKVCACCGFMITGDSSVYCSICGSKTLTRGRVTELIYRSIKVNEGGKALVCPHCDNEEMTAGEFCKICGSNIVNHCADMVDPYTNSQVVKGCHATLGGNARYCSKCGNESSFYQNGWLKDWRSENTKKAIENISVTKDYPFADQGEQEAESGSAV